MRLVTSFCSANRLTISWSKRSAQRCVLFAASISCALTLTWLPERRTLPSSTYRTPSSRPICLASRFLSLYVNAVLREITRTFRRRDRSVVRSSVTPSAKYCCSGSLLRFAKGRTTIDSRGADFASAPAAAEAAVGDASAVTAEVFARGHTHHAA